MVDDGIASRFSKRASAMSSTNGTHQRMTNRLSALRDASLEDGRSERVRILMASHRAESCLTAAAPGREYAWKDSVQNALSLLRASLHEASGRGESAGGLIAALKTEDAGYSHRIDRLQQEFGEIVRRCDSTIEHLAYQGKDESIDFADIRQRVTWLLTSLKHHQAREADLIFEAYGLDIGLVSRSLIGG